MFKITTGRILIACLVIASVVTGCGIIKYTSDKDRLRSEETEAKLYEDNKDIKKVITVTVTTSPKEPSSTVAPDNKNEKVVTTSDGNKVDKKSNNDSINNVNSKKDEIITNDGKKTNTEIKPEENTNIKATGNVNDEVKAKAEQLAGREIEVDDYLIVDEIVTNKLSPNEAKYLYNSAKSNLIATTSLEELERIRSIIFSKLSSGEIDTLRSIGYKYGKGMAIIDPDIDMKKIKENLANKSNNSN